MHRRHLLTLSLLGPLPAAALNLSETDAASGVRAALERGAIAAINGLGRNDGFFAHPTLKIELPGALKDAAKLLKAAGQGKKIDALVLAMNRAAEQAVPQARELLVQTVKKLSVEDALRLVRGRGDDAVTRFFEDKTRAPLQARFLPIVTQATEKQRLADKFNAVAGKAAGLGLLGTAVVLLWRLPEPGPLGAALAFTAGLLALLGGVAALVRPLPYRARKTPEAEP